MSTQIEDQIDRLTAKRRKAGGSSYSQCYSEVLAQHPELYQGYLDDAGERAEDIRRAAQRPALQFTELPGMAMAAQELQWVEEMAEHLQAAEHLDYAAAYAKAVERDPASYDRAEAARQFAEAYPDEAARQFADTWDVSGRSDGPSPWTSSGRSRGPDPYKSGSTRSGVAKSWRGQDLQGRADAGKLEQLRIAPSLTDVQALARAFRADPQLFADCCR
jgi:hypothetical protein